MTCPDSRPHILTIDDEPFLRSSISAYFEDCGYRVSEAEDGLQGVAAIQELRPDVIITDLRMPIIDGLELVRTARRIDCNLPVIVLSGTGIINDAIEALRSGAWDYLAKPLADLTELELVVDRCRERARLIAENKAYHLNLQQLVNERTAELRKLFMAVEQSANTVLIADIHGTIEYVNPKFTESTGYAADEARGRTPSILKSGEHGAEFYQGLWQTITAGQEWRGELCNRRKDGTIYWELCSIAPLRNDSGNLTHYVAIKEDITERKRYEERLYYQANHDAMTGLPNRNNLQQHLELLLQEIDREKQFISLILLDIDKLKCINDTFGHVFGDKLLQEVAQRLKHICPPDSLVARFVGDEFVVIPSMAESALEPQLHAEAIRDALRNFEIDGTELTISVSIGVATWPEDGENVHSLLKNAETAMYEAKRNGRNSIQYYTREYNQQLLERFDMENRLHHALERNEFSLHYQPKVSLPGGTITGMEALLRWTPAGEAPISPSNFIPLLEESGRIVEVGEWVLWQACQQCVEWRQQGLPPLRVSVNISAVQFMRSDLTRTVQNVLQTTGLDPSCLCLELTESMLMSDSTATLEKLADLSGSGITLSLDDFGTGYSSLAYLGRMPIRELKIDQSFTRRMFATHNDTAIVNTIIAMAHSLEMELVAEGVETEEQLRYLAARKCGCIQGYLYSRPLPAAEFRSMIINWSSHEALLKLAP